jgi:hypothetical protein
MAKKCNALLKRADVYALPVNLTYNGISSYPTTVGGVFSIISFVIIAVWFGVQVYKTVSYSFAWQTYNFDIIVAGQPRPVFDITQEQVILANVLIASNKTIFPEKINQYLSVVYAQQSYDQIGNVTWTYYNSTLCQNVIPESDLRYNDLFDWSCPDWSPDSSF